MDLLRQYEEGSQLLKDVLRQFPREMWTYKPGENKWSIHEVIIRLADSEIQSHVRCRMILAEPGTTIPNHDEDQWSVALNYLESDVDEALDTIRLIRRLNSRLLKAVQALEWGNYCVHSVRGKMTLEDWLSTYAEHIPHHIQQLRRIHEHWVVTR
jgi:hypothetical protein